MRAHFEGHTDSLRVLGEQLMANPDMMDILVNNPKAFLDNFGLDIDDETARAIKTQAQRERRPTLPASVIHVDL